MLFAKLGLSTSEIGIYEALLFLTSVLSFFWLSGLTQSLLANYRPAERSHEFFNAFLVLGGISVLVFVAFRLFTEPYAELSGNVDLIDHYRSFSLYILFIGPSFLAEYIFLLKEKAKALVCFGAIAFGIQLAAVVVPVAMGYGLEAAIQGLVFGAIVRFLIVCGLLLRYAEFKIDPTFLSQFLTTAGPLMAATLLSGSAEYIDGFIVSKFFDEGTFAVYRYGAKEFPLVFLIANAFSNGMVPKVAQLGASRAAAEIKKESLKLMHLFFPMSIGLMLVSNWLYPRLFNADFLQSAAIFNVYLLLIVSRLVFPQTLLIGLRKTGTIMWVAMLELVVNFGLSLLLVRLFGLVGIAMATVIASTIEKLFLMAILKRDSNMAMGEYWPWNWHLPYSAVLTAVYLLTA